MPTSTPEFDIDTVIDDPGIRTIVTCGSGGVGKTTTAAAIAIRAAEAGRRVAVLTIDPARRLAQALGLDELDNEPAVVTTVDTSAGGSLEAMMLDMKRTFDEVVLRHADSASAQQILDNPFYQSISSSFAGTQEYMAMERLGQLLDEQVDGADRWDLVVVDTPPSRSALDFLDAPRRLGSFLDGAFIRLLTAPARAGGRAYLKLMNAGMSSLSSVLSKVLGAQLLADVQTFVAAMDTVFGGFRERADQTYRRLADASTSFVVVATPERDALREASYFIDRLTDEGMPLAGVVINRVQMTYVPSLSAPRALAAAETLEADDSADEGKGWATSDTAALLKLHARLAELGGRHATAVAGFSARHPRVPVAQVAAAAQDINDVAELRQIGDELAAEV